jgi:hypothetical protein
VVGWGTTGVQNYNLIQIPVGLNNAIAISAGDHYCPGIERGERGNVQCLWAFGA